MNKNQIKGVQKAKAAGKYKKIGEKHNRAILKEADVLQIKLMLRGGEPQLIASEFGVSVSTINSIKYGSRWSHITAQTVDDYADKLPEPELKEIKGW